MRKEDRVKLESLLIDWLYWFHYSSHSLPHEAYKKSGPVDQSDAKMRGIEDQLRILLHEDPPRILPRS